MDSLAFLREVTRDERQASLLIQELLGQPVSLRERGEVDTLAQPRRQLEVEALAEALGQLQLLRVAEYLDRDRRRRLFASWLLGTFVGVVHGSTLRPGDDKGGECLETPHPPSESLSVPLGESQA